MKERWKENVQFTDLFALVEIDLLLLLLVFFLLFFTSCERGWLDREHICLHHKMLCFGQFRCSLDIFFALESC